MNKVLSTYNYLAFLLLFIASTVCQEAALCNNHSMAYRTINPIINSVTCDVPPTNCVDSVVTANCSLSVTAGAYEEYCTQYGCTYTLELWDVYFDKYTYEYVWTKSDESTDTDTHQDIYIDTDSCSLDPPPDKIGTYYVQVNVKGYIDDEEIDTCSSASYRFEVICGDCSNGCCAGNPGDTTVRNKCVDVLISLGMNPLEASHVGVLHLHEEQASEELCTPELLKYEGKPEGDDVDLVYDNGVLRQVKVPQVLADIVVSNAYYLYEVRFYTNWGNLSGGIYPPSGDMVSKTVIENPNGAANPYTLKVSHVVGGDTKVSLFEWNTSSNHWSLKTGVDPANSSSYLKQEWLKKVLASGVRTETRGILDGSGNMVKKTKQLFQTIGGIECLISQIEDPDSSALTTTNTYYDTGQLKQTLRPDGSWEYYEYNANGRPSKVFSTYLNQGPTTNSSLCRLVEYSYTPVSTGDDGTLRPKHPRRVIEKLQGYEISRTFYVILAGEEQEIRCPSQNADWDYTDNLVTITKTYTSGTFIDKLKSVKRPDGTMDIYEYANNASLTQRTNTVCSGQPNGNPSITDGIRTVTVVGTAGETISRTVTDILSGITIEEHTCTEFDAFRRPKKITYLNGTMKEMSYACCGLETETDWQGVMTTYTYDKLKRLYKSCRSSVHLSKSFDAADRVLSTTRQDTNGTSITLSLTQYDLTGRPTAQSDALGAITTIAYTIDSNGTTVTTTYTNSSTRIETYAKDGSLVKLTGTAVHPVRYTYYVDDGTYEVAHVEINLDGNYNDTNEKITTYHDRVGRPYKTIYGTGTSVYSQDYFNSYGQHSKHVDPDGVITLYLYNGKGELEYTVLDANADGDTDFSGTDRITRTVRDVTTDNGYNVQRSTVYVWATDNTDSNTPISVQETAVNGLHSWSTNYGLGSHSQTVFTTNGGIVTVNFTNTVADGTYVVKKFQSGLLLSTTSYNSNNAQLGQATNQYDSHNRLWKVTDARTGTTTYGYDNADHITIVTTPAPDQDQNAQTTTTYYNKMGWIEMTALPDSTSVTNEYFANGTLKKTYGSRTYPVEYQYDVQGRMTSMKTWQNTNDFAVTTWSYDTQRGWLTEKDYQGTNGPTYTYKASGRLLTRTWARGQIVTTYGYNNAGDLTSIDYSGSTPDVTMTYDRLGRLKTVARNSITSTLTYNNASQLLCESYSGGSLAGLSVTNEYDNLLRLQQTTAKSSTNLALETYGYEAYSSRLLSAADGNYMATYSYLGNSPLVSLIAFTNTATTNQLTTARTYDNINRLVSIATEINGTTVYSSTNLYNDANQRIRKKEVSGYYWTNQYDVLGQLSSSKKYDSSTNQVSNRQYEYSFDYIGNRISTLINGSTNTYNDNLLNQYTTNVMSGTTNVFTHDADGNLESDRLWTYTWDGENRLIQMQSQTSVDEGNRRRLVFEYDWQGRRIRKAVYAWVSGDYSTTATTDIKYLYDGWNLIAELDASNNLVRSYLWGLDLSGNRQGAGGVGGLILFKRNTQTPTYHFASYDGNGNVMALVAASDGAVTAQYEYSPFGETLSATGDQASSNPFRFSSKYTDDETGLLYYGYRYYNPTTGRWLSRDPINEAGSQVLMLHVQRFNLKEENNLYRFALNDPINKYDPDGRVVPAVPVVIIIAGSVVIEFGVRIYCVCAFKNGQEAYIRTPTAILAHFSALILSAIESYCDGPGTVRLHLWKDENGDCHDQLVIICLPKKSSGGGGA